MRHEDMLVRMEAKQEAWTSAMSREFAKALGESMERSQQAA